MVLRTYRFEVGPTGSRTYDFKWAISLTLDLECIFIFSRRRPAWTDRILWLNAPSQPIRQLSYDSHPDILISDHKPVSSEFAVEVFMNRRYGAITQQYPGPKCR